MGIRAANHDGKEVVVVDPGDIKFWNRRSLPMYLQAEAAECGIACIAMLSSYWGCNIDIAGMRRRFVVSIKGTTIAALVRMADALGLQTRPLKLELSEVTQLALPCIVHWDMNHFVVLKRIRGKTLQIHDPAVGPRGFGWDEFSKHFTGVALEASPGGGFKRETDLRRVSFRELIGNVRGLVPGLAKLLLLGLALQVVALCGPFYMQWVVDQVLVSADRDLLEVLGLGFLILVGVQVAMEAVRSWMTTALSTSVRFQWYGNTFSHLMRLPQSYFEKRHLGDIVSRFGSIGAIQSAVTGQVVEAIIDGLMVTLALVAMWIYSAKLSMLALFAVFIYGLLRWGLFRLLRVATSEQISKAAKQQTLFLESIRGVQTIRLFDRAAERKTVWMNTLAEQMNCELRLAKYGISYHAANTVLFGCERVVILWLAALQVVEAKLTVGMLFAYIAFKDQFTSRMSSLIDKVADVALLRVQADRVADIVLSEPEPEEEGIAQPTVNEKGSVELIDICFSYADSEPLVLQGVSIAIPAGQCVAIAGASGCGKTTLVKIILGLLNPSEGKVVVGGRSLEQVGRKVFRQGTGCVMQDDSLFSGTISDNISFFDPAPDPAKIEQCARLSAIDREICEMPMGYLSLVGDLGIGLSGGQRQRIILARALYRSPDILVLDEATSHLDVGNEQKISAAVQRLCMTRIVVAHRPETLNLCDRVIVLDKGRVVSDTKNQALAGH